MVYKNARIYCSDFQFYSGAFEVKNGKFGKILPEEVPEDAIDLDGAFAIPGLIDVHTHGNSGYDFSDGNYQGLKSMAKYYLSCGVTSFVPASMTLPYEVLSKAFATAKLLVTESSSDCACLRGIRMEGPYFSETKKGAQNAAYLKSPDFIGFRKLYEDCEGLVRIVDIAPELPGAEDFIRKASDFCTVSVAHTDADYEQAKAGFAAGARHLTHLYNAMPGINHRNPGVIPAAVENKNVRAEIVCDGLHVHPAAVRLAFTMFGSNRMVLVSDSGRCAGLPEGTKFELGGQMATLIHGVARLADGTIACSSVNLWQCLQNAINFGIPMEDAIRAATYNPACVLGVQEHVGSISEGLLADFIVCDSNFERKAVYLAGEKVSYA